MDASPQNTYYLRTFGCQMNEHDSERIAGVLEGMGYLPVSEPEEGKLLVYNTCSIREKADTRLLGNLGAARRLKAHEPERVVIVAGCLAQSRRDSFLAEHPYVDILVGPQSLHLLPALVEERQAGGARAGAYEEVTTHWSAELPRARRRGPVAWLQIMAGCSNFCSYCIVPYVRGPEASRTPADIVAEARALVREGVKELTLLGQNVNAYGLEPGFGQGQGFPGLLGSLSNIEGLERLRFMTSHPKDVSPALIEAMATLEPVCEHLHLPAQSGSDRVLAAMRRGYDVQTYLDVVARLRAAIPGLALTTDLIVGFPGETDEDFQATLDLVDEVGFDAAFTFKYSPRPQTKAADLARRVPPDVLEPRMRRLVDLTQAWGRARNEALVGSTVEVLVEGRSRRDAESVMGRTRSHKTVNLRSDAVVGDLVWATIKRASSTSLQGAAAERPESSSAASSTQAAPCAPPASV